jgi:hypothetical protein
VCKEIASFKNVMNRTGKRVRLHGRQHERRRNGESIVAATQPPFIARITGSGAVDVIDGEGADK